MSSSSPSSLCLRCYSRSLRPLSRSNASQSAAFSTSRSLDANPPKKKAVVAKPTARQGKTLRLSKNIRTSNARPPAVGERKALRKKVSLSNVNALEILGLRELKPKDVGVEGLQRLDEQVVGFDESTVDALRALEVFKPTQGWGLFRRPTTLVRKETIALAANMELVAGNRDEKRVSQMIVSGARDSGKSVLQLQALALARLKKWMIIHIPEAKDLTNAQTAYQPVTAKDGAQVYIQPTFTAKLLQNIANANRELLSQLRLSKEHSLPMPVQSNISLDRFVELGARDPDLAYPIWQALWEELRTPSNAQAEGQQRPPVLFTLDGLNHIMRNSAYLDADVKPIHAHDLALVRDFTRLMTADATELPNGAMILAATTESNRIAAPTLDFQIAARLAEQGSGKAPKRDPYFAHDARVEAALVKALILRVEGLSRRGAKAIMEYYARSGMLRSTVTDGLVSEKWVLAGGGIVGQLERASVRARF